MIAGSCLCGAVAYEADALSGPIGHCHCRTCRKAHSAAFPHLAAAEPSHRAAVGSQAQLSVRALAMASREAGGWESFWCSHQTDQRSNRHATCSAHQPQPFALTPLFKLPGYRVPRPPPEYRGVQDEEWKYSGRSNRTEIMDYNAKPTSNNPLDKYQEEAIYK